MEPYDSTHSSYSLSGSFSPYATPVYPDCDEAAEDRRAGAGEVVDSIMGSEKVRVDKLSVRAAANNVEEMSINLVLSDARCVSIGFMA